MNKNVEEYMIIKNRLAEQRLAKRIDAISYQVYSERVRQKDLCNVDNERLKQEIEEVKTDIRNQTQKTEVLAEMMADIIRERMIAEQEYSDFRGRNSDFWEVLFLKNKKVHRKSQFALSKIIPLDEYVEFEVCGYGNCIYFFMRGYQGAKISVEVQLQNGESIKRTIAFVREGRYAVPVKEIHGRAVIKFQACNRSSIARVLLLKSKKDNLAAYIL